MKEPVIKNRALRHTVATIKRNIAEMNDPTQIAAELAEKWHDTRISKRMFKAIILSAIEEATEEITADRDEAREQRDWLIKECERIGVSVLVQIGVPVSRCYRLSRAAQDTGIVPAQSGDCQVLYDYRGRTTEQVNKPKP